MNADEVLSYIQHRVDPPVYERWYRHIALANWKEETTEETIEIRVPNEFTRRRFDQEFRKHLEEAVLRLYGRVLTIVVTMLADPADEAADHFLPRKGSEAAAHLDELVELHLSSLTPNELNALRKRAAEEIEHDLKSNRTFAELFVRAAKDDHEKAMRLQVEARIRSYLEHELLAAAPRRTTPQGPDQQKKG